jgi:hypothetical protein
MQVPIEEAESAARPDKILCLSDAVPRHRTRAGPTKKAPRASSPGSFHGIAAHMAVFPFMFPMEEQDRSSGKCRREQS